METPAVKSATDKLSIRMLEVVKSFLYLTKYQYYAIVVKKKSGCGSKFQQSVVSLEKYMKVTAMKIVNNFR